jgi:hypothetical protein
MGYVKVADVVGWGAFVRRSWLFVRTQNAKSYVRQIYDILIALPRSYTFLPRIRTDKSTKIKKSGVFKY